MTVKQQGAFPSEKSLRSLLNHKWKPRVKALSFKQLSNLQRFRGVKIGKMCEDLVPFSDVSTPKAKSCPCIRRLFPIVCQLLLFIRPAQSSWRRVKRGLLCIFTIRIQCQYERRPGIGGGDIQGGATVLDFLVFAFLFKRS